MGIFDKKSSIPRQELRSTFKKDSGIIPGTGGKKYFQKEREGIVKEVFGPKYGSDISKNDYRRAVRDLNLEKRAAKTPGERSTLDREIKYLKQRGGKSL